MVSTLTSHILKVPAQPAPPGDGGKLPSIPTLGTERSCGPQSAAHTTTPPRASPPLAERVTCRLQKENRHFRWCLILQSNLCRLKGFLSSLWDEMGQERLGRPEVSPQEVCGPPRSQGGKWVWLEKEARPLQEQSFVKISCCHPQERTGWRRGQRKKDLQRKSTECLKGATVPPSAPPSRENRLRGLTSCTSCSFLTRIQCQAAASPSFRGQGPRAARGRATGRPPLPQLSGRQVLPS